MMTPKKLHRLKFMLFLGMAVVCPAILLIRSDTSKVDANGIAITVTCFLVIAAVYGWKYRKTPENAVFYNISKQSPEEQLRMSRWVGKVLAIAGPLIGYTTYRNLLVLQSGAAKSVSLMSPVGLVYRHFGFWPAVLTWPVICGYVIMMCIFRIERAKALLGYRETANGS